jgi:hypothetical protein
LGLNRLEAYILRSFVPSKAPSWREIPHTGFSFWYAHWTSNNSRTLRYQAWSRVEASMTSLIQLQRSCHSPESTPLRSRGSFTRAGPPTPASRSGTCIGCERENRLSIACVVRNSGLISVPVLCFVPRDLLQRSWSHASSGKVWLSSYLSGTHLGRAGIPDSANTSRPTHDSVSDYSGFSFWYAHRTQDGSHLLE